MLPSAGVISLIKVLLSFKNHQIPALLHFKKLNPLIEFDDSAFYINTEAINWRSNNGKPLMSALNSFGHSGTNVHLVVEEYITHQETQDNTGPVLISLSAGNEAGLKTYAEKLRVFLDLQSTEGISLTNIAYTLQTGREPMKERVIFMVKNVSELINKLKSFSLNEKIEGCWTGRQIISMFSSDEDTQEMVLKWITKGKHDKLAQLWVQGLDVDWDLFYKKGVKPHRISLPTYPFTRERYRIDEGSEVKSEIYEEEPVEHQVIRFE